MGDSPPLQLSPVTRSFFRKTSRIKVDLVYMKSSKNESVLWISYGNGDFLNF